MKLIACLIWYDETVEELERAVYSIRGFADGLVALDGAFARFPYGASRPWSESEQLTSILKNAAYTGQDDNFEVLAYQPTAAGRWPGFEGNEVEKRNASLRMAGYLGADWVINVDADMHLLSDSDWAKPRLIEARRLLEETHFDVADIAIGMDAVRCCFRWTPTLWYDRTHYFVRDGERVLALPISSLSREKLGVPELEGSLSLTDHVMFSHPARQYVERRKKQQEWYRLRDSQGIEAL